MFQLSHVKILLFSKTQLNCLILQELFLHCVFFFLPTPGSSIPQPFVKLEFIGTAASVLSWAVSGTISLLAHAKHFGGNLSWFPQITGIGRLDVLIQTHLVIFEEEEMGWDASGTHVGHGE